MSDENNTPQPQPRIASVSPASFAYPVVIEKKDNAHASGGMMVDTWLAGQALNGLLAAGVPPAIAASQAVEAAHALVHALNRRRVQIYREEMADA